MVRWVSDMTKEEREKLNKDTQVSVEISNLSKESSRGDLVGAAKDNAITSGIKNIDGKAKSRAWKKKDFEVLLKDCAEYFLVENAKMVQEGGMIRFIVFRGDQFERNEWYPKDNIFRIREYNEEGDSRTN